MIKYVLFFVAFRFLIQRVSDTYLEGTSRCKELVSFAQETDIDSARNVYCFEAVQEDQRLTLETLRTYKLGFLATNATYAYDSEVIEYACKLPWYVSETLEWTAGLTPLCLVWLVFQVATWLWSKRPKKVIKPVTPPPSPPPMDRPPMIPRSTHNGIRKRVSKTPKTPKTPMHTREEMSLMDNLSKLANISPKLRDRIMGEDV